MAESQQGGDKSTGNVENTLQENCVEYCIFLIDPKAPSDPRRQLSRLEDLRKSALQLTTRLTGGYIWQRGSFNLEVVTVQGQLETLRRSNKDI